MQTTMQFMEITEVHPVPMVLSANEEQIVDVIYSSGRQGIISAEINEALPHLPYGTTTSRFKKLTRMGVIERIGQRQGPFGKMQAIWRHTAFSTQKGQEF